MWREILDLRKSQEYTVSQIIMDVCMLIFLRWGTVHWQYVSRGLVSYYLVVYTYVRAYVKYFYAGE